MREILHLLPYLRRYRREFFLGSLALVIASTVTLFGPWVTKLAIDDIVGGKSVARLPMFAALLVGIAVVQGIFRFWMRSTLIGASRLIEFDLRNDLFRKVLSLSTDWFEKTKTGDIMARATNDLNAVRMFAGPGIMYLLGTIVTFLVGVSFMAAIDARLTLIALIPLPVLALLVKQLGAASHVLFEQVQDQYGRVTARVQENLAGIRVVKAFAEEESEIRDFRVENEDLVRKNLLLVRIWGFFYPVMTLLAGVAAVIVLAEGGRGVMSGRIGIGDFVAFNWYLGLLIWPTIALGWVTNLLQRGAASMGRIQAVLAEEPRIQGGGLAPAAIRGDLEFRDVSFRYGADSRGLSDLSFRVPAGGTVAVVGATGSGKSTLIELLPRLRDPSSGTVLVDGRDARELTLEALRGAIGMVPQEPFLFSDTIRENIGYGLQEDAGPRTEERIVAAARAAGVWDEISGFPKGLDTLLGERGVNLSGGQKQRVTLARALASDPPILVLDDALSSVDTETERRILDNLKVVFAGRTNVVISHRLSMVQDADLILVLEEGRLAECGTHGELMTRGRVYPKIYERELLRRELDRL